MGKSRKVEIAANTASRGKPRPTSSNSSATKIPTRQRQMPMGRNPGDARHGGGNC